MDVACLLFTSANKKSAQCYVDIEQSTSKRPWNSTATWCSPRSRTAPCAYNMLMLAGPYNPQLKQWNAATMANTCMGVWVQGATLL